MAQEKEDHEVIETGESLPAELLDFLADAKKQNTEHKIELYRRLVKHYGNNKDKHEFLECYYDDTPTFKQIGETFGSGSYTLNIHYTNKKGSRIHTSRYVNIAEIFDRRREEKERAATKAAAPNVSNGSETGAYLQLLQTQNNVMFETMLNIMDKVISINNKPVENSTGFEKLQNGLNSLLLKSASQQQELIQTMTKQNLKSIDPDYEVEPEGTTEVFGILKWIWDNYGQKILKGTKAFRNLARKEVQGSDQLKAILANPEAYKAAYDQLIADDVPIADVENLLNIVGVPSPDELLKNTVPMQQAEG